MSGNIHPTNCKCSYCNAPIRFDSIQDAIDYVEYLQAEEEMIVKKKNNNNTRTFYWFKRVLYCALHDIEDCRVCAPNL